MARDIAYLVKRSGVYAAKHQKASGAWTHHSFHTTRVAEAKVLFEQFRQDVLQRKELELNRVVSIPLSQLVAEHLADVEQNQAASWLVKQRNYLKHYVLPFMGEKRLSTDVTGPLLRSTSAGAGKPG